VSTVRVSRMTRKTNVHDTIVPAATLIGVDWSIPYKLNESRVTRSTQNAKYSASPDPRLHCALLLYRRTKNNIRHQRVSRTNARVPKHEAIEFSMRPLSCFCNDKKASRSVRNFGLETSCSPCTRRNKLRYVWTASKSRRDFKRCERARRKRLKSWRVAKERISKSAAAGESDFAKVKNSSSGVDVNVDPRQN
jgi:hypothetical protein